MIDFDDAVKNLEETQYNEVKVTTRTQSQKLRALRDEFGFQKTEPKKEVEDDETT